MSHRVSVTNALEGRIGYIVTIFPDTTQTFVAREVESLKQRGFDISMFSLKRPDVMPSQALSASDTLDSCEYARPDEIFRYVISNLIALLGHPVRYTAALAAFVREGIGMEPRAFCRLLFHFFWGIGLSARAKRLGIRHFHCHFASACSAALAANLFSDIPFSFTAHASGDIFVKPVLLNMKVRQAQFVVPVCEYSKRYLDSVTAFEHSGKLHRVYNGVDVREPERFVMLPEDRRVRRQEKGDVLNLISVGSLVGVKGHATLIETCGILRNEGFAIHCKIIGRGPEQIVLERKINEADLSTVVELTGVLPIGEVYRALESADIFVLLSEIGVNGYRDGFPTVILEAMAMELPVVSTWISGIPEIVANNVTGILVPERNPLAASTAIRRLLLDPALRTQLGSAGRRRVTRDFELDASAGELAQLFHDHA